MNEAEMLEQIAELKEENAKITAELKIAQSKLDFLKAVLSTLVGSIRKACDETDSPLRAV